MDDNKGNVMHVDQQELFPESVPAHKLRRPSAMTSLKGDAGIYDFQQKFSVRLSYDILVFAVLGVVIFIIAAYVLGVENGEQDVLEFRAQNLTSVNLDELKITSRRQIPSSGFTEVPTSGQIHRDSTEKSLAKNKTVQNAYFYAIQVASFKNQVVAEAEKDRLLRKKHKAFILRDKSKKTGTVWYKIYVGPYENNDLANQNKPSMIEEGFTDCLVRRMSWNTYQNSLFRGDV